MPECSFHPGVETGVRCVSCGRPICPKDFVETPVGYKCPDCARQLPSVRRGARPAQVGKAALAAAAVGCGGAFVLAFLGVYDLIVAILLGVLTGEAARRASGGHRSGQIAAVAAVSVASGTFFAGFDLLSTGLAVAAAILYVRSNRR